MHGKAFTDFIEELIADVDKMLPGEKFKIDEAVLKHKWPLWQRKWAKTKENQEAEKLLDEVATIFAQALSQHIELTPPPWFLCCIPDWMYTKVDGYTFKQQLAQNDASLTGKIVTKLQANKQQIKTSLSQKVLN